MEMEKHRDNYGHAQVHMDTDGDRQRPWPLALPQVYVMLCGRPPFWDKHPRKLFKRIISAPLEFPDAYGWDQVSADAKALLSKMLVKDPAARITAAACLEDPWLKDATPLYAKQLPHSSLANLNAYCDGAL